MEAPSLHFKWRMNMDPMRKMADICPSLKRFVTVVASFSTVMYCFVNGAHDLGLTWGGAGHASPIASPWFGGGTDICCPLTGAGVQGGPGAAVHVRQPEWSGSRICGWRYCADWCPHACDCCSAMPSQRGGRCTMAPELIRCMVFCTERCSKELWNNVMSWKCAILLILIKLNWIFCQLPLPSRCVMGVIVYNQISRMEKQPSRRRPIPTGWGDHCYHRVGSYYNIKVLFCFFFFSPPKALKTLNFQKLRPEEIRHLDSLQVSRVTLY